MTKTVGRNSFDSVWLTLITETGGTNFAHSRGRERPGARELVKDALKLAVVDHHKHPKQVAKLLKKYGFTKAAKILSSQLPRNHSTRMGNFGEVVSSEHLRQRYGYNMPVFKLRYAENFLMPTRGEDIVCFELGPNGRITAIVIGEAKTLATYSKAVAKKAHDKLASAYHPFPVSLSLIATILYDQEQDQLADQVEEIIAALTLKAFPCKNWIFLVTGSESENPFDWLKSADDVVQNLSCVDIFLPDLQSLVNEVFESPVPS